MARGYIRLSIETTTVLFFLWIIFRKIQFYFFPYKQSLLRYRRSHQTYAIVTGGSAGIGFGYAQELVANGFGVILLASRKERLDAAAKQLQTETPGANVRTIVYDAFKADSKELIAALQPVMELPITLLVNNLGANPIDGFYAPLPKYTAEDVINTINVNTTFMVQLTRIMIPTLDRNGPSAIINMGSVAEVGSPWLVLYGACKAFVTSLSTGLAREAIARGWKIDCLGILTGEVYSETNNYAMAPGSPTARQYAKIVLDRVEMAVDQGTWVVSPYWGHAIPMFLLQNLPEKAIQFMLNDNMKTKMEAYAKLK